MIVHLGLVKKYIWFLKKEFKEKLTRTDNDSEKYFHATLRKVEKKDTEQTRSI